MVFRHDLREQSFDCHQDWMMTRRRLRTGFIPERQLRLPVLIHLRRRRDIIRRERLAGTMPALGVAGPEWPQVRN